VEYWIGAVRSVANFDVFALPGLACVIGSSVIGKFWVSALLPPGIGLVFGIQFLLQVRRSKIENQLDESWDAATWEKVKLEVGDDNTHACSQDDQARVKQLETKTDESDRIRFTESETPEDTIRAAMTRHAITIAHAKQSCIGWTFILIFIVCESTIITDCVPM
jgi:hypothetical protein